MSCHLASMFPPASAMNESVSRATVLYVGSIGRATACSGPAGSLRTSCDAASGCRTRSVGDNRSYPAEDIAALIQRPPTRRTSAGIAMRPTTSCGVSTLEARAFAFLSGDEGLGLTPLGSAGRRHPSVLLDTAVAAKVRRRCPRCMCPR